MTANPTPSKRQEERLEMEKDFKENALLIISQMWKLSPQHPTELMDEVIHSIFFLGMINTPPFKPEELVSDADILKILELHYPKPFQQYTTHLPRRSPMSCVLDMIVSQSGPEDETVVIEELQKFISRLMNGTDQLVSSTICITQADKDKSNSKKYYGVSMSTSGALPGQIIIAASCLCYWDNYVAGAVETYYPNKVKKTYFDGTFRLPQQVRCQAFSLTDKAENKKGKKPKEKLPCKSCGNLFGLTTSETKVWAYGNCAECESVSNLLKNEQGVRENVQLVSDANRKTAGEELLKELIKRLRSVKFIGRKKYQPVYYKPQQV